MHPIRDTVAAIGAAWTAAIAALLGIALIAGAGIWIATVTSGARGNASVTRQHNSGGNQIAQNKTLLGDYNTVQADLDQIRTLTADVQTQQDRTNLQGLRLNCAADVHTYNADAASILAAGYLPPGQPHALDGALCTATAPSLAPAPTTSNW